MNLILDNISQMTFDAQTRILNIKILDNAEVNIQNILRHLVIRNKLCEKMHYVALIDAENYYVINSNVTEFISKISKKNCLGNVFYNVNLANKLTIHFYNKTYQFASPLYIQKSYIQAVGFATNNLLVHYNSA